MTESGALVRKVPMSLNEIREKVRAYVADTLLERQAVDLSDDTPLAIGGLLDSFAAMMLANYLEEEFGVRIDTETLPASDFATLDAIARTVERLATS